MLNIDTAKIKKTGEDMIKLSEELSFIIDELYLRIYNMNKTTGEWVSNSAALYIKEVNSVDRKDAISFKNTLCEFGNNLVNSANKYEKEINSKM